MHSAAIASDEVVAAYHDLFVNRLAYTLQAATPKAETRRCFYYRPKGRVALTDAIIRSHLQGEITIGLYAINPESQRCKWVAIDADYGDALQDLLKLQWELRRDGIDAALEKSRRGGHLWIFANEPLLARHCRLYIDSVARRLKVPVKGAHRSAGGSELSAVLGDGIEIFPKQDELRADEFGNALRGPLGIHRGTGKRYWFYGADYNLESQLAYVGRLKKITEAQMDRFVAGIKMTSEVQVPSSEPPTRVAVPVRRFAPYTSFSILDYVGGRRRRIGRNFFTRCPSCAQQGRDRSEDNLAICVADPRKYRCWAGCTKEEIRAAVGCPIRHFRQSSVG